ncbi:hypothetical protein AX15_002662 [Amanita polypyramis BW_CC]|nr:hypothetical protein AX15_002662 [Amanita polypyramis BW_CC]
MGYRLPSPDENPREQARVLMDKKQAIEAELITQTSILKANECDMDAPLVDRDGFPRADIDVWTVRTARVRIIELRNDLSAVMSAIAKALEGVFDPALAQQASAPSPEDELKPFARVSAVSPGSPASQAGLQPNDLIVKFGHLTSMMMGSSMQPIAKLVNENENRHIIVRVLRLEQTLHLSLTPNKGWGGRGLLGCHVVPYPSS